jgi:PAS domain S-box-containing protein
MRIHGRADSNPCSGIPFGPALKQFALVMASVAGSTFLAFALRFYLEGEAPLLPFTLGVMAAAFYGGFVPALSATLLSFLVADYFFIEPTAQLLPISAMHVSLFALFMAVGISISFLRAALARANVGLRASLERLQLAALHARIGFHEYIPSDDRQVWTPEMEHLFGLQTGTFAGSYADWVTRMHPEDRDRVLSGRSRCISQRETEWNYEYRAILPNGEIRWMEGRSKLFFSKSGVLERILGATVDVTERCELQHNLIERSAQLARSNRELERFASVVSHDLQEPLRGITTLTELYLRRAQSTLDEKSAHLLHTALSSADRMKQLIDAILELARANGDRLETKASVNAGEILAMALEDLAQKTQKLERQLRSIRYRWFKGTRPNWYGCFVTSSGAH